MTYKESLCRKKIKPSKLQKYELDGQILKKKYNCIISLSQKVICASLIIKNILIKLWNMLRKKGESQNILLSSCKTYVQGQESTIWTDHNEI